MKRSMHLIGSYFNTSRMAADYTRDYYLDAGKRFQALTGDGPARAKALAAWRARLRRNWGGIRGEDVRSNVESALLVGDKIEVVARVRAALRRADIPQLSTGPVVTTPEFTLDLASKRAQREGVEVKLTPTEWHLVEALVRHPGMLVAGTQLLAEVWGPGFEKETNYLRVYFAQIRRKLEADPSQPRHFVTEPGLGYRFEP